eukprot:Amastigsp_a348253_7.p1 type:complete len:366 gc:universal Amastigsp_a348253_7:1115-18(-)
MNPRFLRFTTVTAPLFSRTISLWARRDAPGAARRLTRAGRSQSNAAYLALGVKDALLVRVQDPVNASSPYLVGPSKIALARRLGAFDPHEVRFEALSESSVVIEPSSPADALGTEDPRVVFDENTSTYFLFYTSVAKVGDDVIAYLSLATARDPTTAAGWTKHGYVFPFLSWSKSAALLIRSAPSPSLLFWGDSSLVAGLQVATTTNLLNYTYNATVWLPVRPDSWDSALVEAGPLPLALSDGNFLFLYNSARQGFPSPKPGWTEQYNVGWVVLDAADPTTIVERSAEPLLSPTLAWQNGTSPSVLGLTPNVVFCEGWQRYPGDTTGNRFLAYFGAADSVVGVAEIAVVVPERRGGHYSVRAKVL